ncbi:annexin A6-like isoform X1 [Argopecten irradians]|uniref:annexin A6-like isoform X1 n=1 Tax=Argopecten irradians TaxID=31199 RepID=UPI003723A53E
MVKHVGNGENIQPNRVKKTENSPPRHVGNSENIQPVGETGNMLTCHVVVKTESTKLHLDEKTESPNSDFFGKVKNIHPDYTEKKENVHHIPEGKAKSSHSNPVREKENAHLNHGGKDESIHPNLRGKVESTQFSLLGKGDNSRMGDNQRNGDNPVITHPSKLRKGDQSVIIHKGRMKKKAESFSIIARYKRIETQFAKLREIKDKGLNPNPVLPAIRSNTHDYSSNHDSKFLSVKLDDKCEIEKSFDDTVRFSNSVVTSGGGGTGRPVSRDDRNPLLSQVGDNIGNSGESPGGSSGDGNPLLSQVGDNKGNSGESPGGSSGDGNPLLSQVGDNLGNSVESPGGSSGDGNPLLSQVGDNIVNSGESPGGGDGEGFMIGVSIRGIDVDKQEYTNIRSSDQNFEEQLRRDKESSQLDNSRQLVRVDSNYTSVTDSLKKGFHRSHISVSSSVGKLSFLTKSGGSMDGSDKYNDDMRSETTEGGKTSRSERSSIQGDKKDPQQAQTDSDAKQLFNASKLIGKVHPEDILIRTCVRRNHKQRMKTKARFEELYELELIPELKSGLGASWFLLIDALLDDHSSSARTMHDALEEGNYCSAVEILCLTTPQSLANMNDLYNKDYAVSLESDINDKTEAPERTLLLALHKGRDESVKAVEKEAEKDADALYESGDGRWSSDTGPFIKMVCARNFAHIRVVFNLYRVLTGGKDVIDDIKNECSRQYADCLVTMVNCVRGADTYFADKIFKNMSAKDGDFVNMLVERSEVDMPAIKRAYKKKYDAELVDDLQHKCNHPTINVLIELINKIPQGQGKKSKPPVPVGAVKRPARRPSNTQTKEQEASTPRNPLAAPSQRVTAEVVSQRQGQEIAREKEREAREREKGQKKEKEMMKKNVSGTVKPSKSFHPDDDCDKLHDAVGKYGTDETQITEILTQRCNVQRQQIKKLYNSKFKQDLQKDLEGVLQGDYEEILLSLLQTPAVYDARSIHEALDGMGSRDSTLIGIIVTRDKQEKTAIGDHYRKAYKTDVESDIKKEGSDSDFANLLVAIWSDERDATTVNQTRAQQEAKMLLRNGKAVHPTDETFVNLMVKSSHAQVKATFQEYDKLAGQDIYAGLITAGLGDDEDGYISLAMAVQDPHDFYAEKLNSCFSSMGVNDNMLIRMTVSRSERDLGEIKSRLQDKYKKSLSQLIRTECKGDYKQLLLEIVGE